MNVFPLIVMLFASDSATLTLVPNTKEILQRDHVLLLSLLENNSISAVKLLGDIRPGPRWFRHEIQQKGKWVKIRPAVDQLGPSDTAGEGPFLSGKSTFAECDVLHRRSREGEFLFDAPGTYQIRAVATMPWGELASEPVTIKVRKRADEDLKKIETIRPSELWVLALPRVDRPLPDKLLQLRSVGGNIAGTIDQWRMAQAACEGGEWKGSRITKGSNCEWLQANLDPVAYEHTLERLGTYYFAKRDWDGLSRVALAMKHDSMHRREFIDQIELVTKPPTPAMP